MSKLNDLSNQKSTGRPCDEKIDDFILKQLENDPHARMIERKSWNVLSTILSHLKDIFNMKCLHLKWIPHSLNSFSKKKKCFIFKFTFKAIRRCFEE